MSRISLHVESSRKSGLRSLSKISWETLSVMSRRGAPTSRRQIYISLSRHDVDLHVATSFLTPSLPRHDVDVHVATSIGTGPCHVATWIYTSRRRLVMCSVTSRRGLVYSL